MHWSFWIHVLYISGTVSFAVTAVLAIRRDKDIDIIGTILLGLVASVGGGTIRDVILNVPVFWAQEQYFLWIAAASSVAAFYFRKLFAERNVFTLLLYLDAFGTAMFSILATAKAWDLGFGLPVAPVILGLVTAIGGGVMRDVLAGRSNLLVRPELYATPMILGCIVFVFVLQYFPNYRSPGGVVCIFGAFALRVAAIHWNLSMAIFSPKWKEAEDHDS